MAIYLKSPIFYSNKNQILFYCSKFVIALVKGFCLVRDMPECTTEFPKIKISRDISSSRGLFKYNVIS